ncbi:MAG: response regulator [Nitrospirae bacterium]|nr:response regulator [Nitrospirota bacterium]
MPAQVLVVDQNPLVQTTIENCLNSQNCEVTSVRDALSGLDLAYKIKPDLMIADLRMEGLMVYSFCARVKQKPFLSHIPIFLLVQQSDVFDEARLRQSGVVGFIQKPVDPQRLKETLGSYLAQGTLASVPESPSIPGAQSRVSETTRTEMNGRAPYSENLAEEVQPVGTDNTLYDRTMADSKVTHSLIQPDETIKIDDLMDWAQPEVSPFSEVMSAVPLEDSSEATQFADATQVLDENLKESLYSPEDFSEVTQFADVTALTGNSNEKSQLSRSLRPEEERAEVRNPDPNQVRKSVTETREPTQSSSVNGKSAPPDMSLSKKPESVMQGDKIDISNAAEKIIEKIAWEVVPFLAEQAIKKEMIATMIEKVIWEVLPPIAEQSVKAAIKKMNEEADLSPS